MAEVCVCLTARCPHRLTKYKGTGIKGAEGLGGTGPTFESLGGTCPQASPDPRLEYDQSTPHNRNKIVRKILGDILHIFLV